MDQSYTWDGSSDGCTKSCKIAPKCISNHRKMSKTNMDSDFRVVRNTRRRPTCENASKRIDFCSFCFCFAHAMVKKSIEIVENSPQNYHKKCETQCCNGQEHAPSTNVRKCILTVQTRSFLSFPMLLCSRHGCKNRSKSLKTYH